MLDLQREYQYMKADIDSAIQKCLQHQQWILGTEVKALEEEVAKYLNVKYCLGVSSGTDALVISLRAIALKLKGKEHFEKTDKILTPSFTFTATGEAILRAGATPVFVDIDPQTFNISPEKIREYLEKQSQPTQPIEPAQPAQPSKVVGILPVHLYGQSCDMTEIMKIAKEHGLFVVEDTAQAFGSEHNNQKSGSIGDAGAFSFFPSKTLGGFGDGGMIATNDDKIFEFAGILRKHGGKDKYNADYLGYNARLDTIQAAILLAKLKHIDSINTKRIELADKYNNHLQNNKNIITPINKENSKFSHVYHQYTLRVLNGKRDDLQAHLKQNGIQTMNYYKIPLHKMIVFKDRCELADNLPETEKAASEVINLPAEPLMENEEIKRVTETIQNFA